MGVERLGDDAHIGYAGTFHGIHHGGESAERNILVGAHENGLVLRVAHFLPQLGTDLVDVDGIVAQKNALLFIDAFHGLGTSGAATLRAVAPGISEALITTAAGLVAAIPAVIAYNLIGGSIREFASRGDDFALEMLNAVERQAPVTVTRTVMEAPEVRR